MAKTDFVNGTTVVTAEFLDSIYLTDGGHKHDGGSEDGSASKIDPETETDWGTNAAAPAKTTDSVSEVLWTFAHAAAGIFSLAVDALKGVRFISASGGKLYIGSAAATGDHDLECADIDCSSLDASGAIEANSAVISTTALIGTVTAANVNVTDDLVVIDDASVGGDLTVTGDTASGSVTSNLVTPASGNSVYVGTAAATANRDIRARDVILTGDLDCVDIQADSSTVSGNVSVGGTCAVIGVLTNSAVPWAVLHITGTTVDKDPLSRVTSVTNSLTGYYTISLSSAVASTESVVCVTPTEGAIVDAHFQDTSTLLVSFQTHEGVPANQTYGFSVVIWSL